VENTAATAQRHLSQPGGSTSRAHLKDGQIDYEDGAITYNSSPEQRWTLLKLLDDDYLGSEMTDRKYAADNKHSL